MSRGIVMSAAVICFAVTSLVGAAAKADGLGLEIEASVWQSAGQAGFQIGSPVWVISELEYPMDGVLAEIRAACPVFGTDVWAFRLQGRYAGQLSYEGTSGDSDFLDIPGVRSHYSESDSKADVSIWDADLLLTLTPFGGKESVLGSLEFGVFAGFGSQTFDYEDENLEAWYDYGADHFTYDGPVSTYEFEFSGMRTGARISVNPIQSVKLTAEAVVMNDVEAKGTGYWILRDYQFWQKADGEGMIVNIKAAWQILDNLGVFAAYRSVDFKCDDNGVESSVEGGTPYENWPIVPQITGEYTGVECGAIVTF
jgi:hypothetical protein